VQTLGVCAFEVAVLVLAILTMLLVASRLGHRALVAFLACMTATSGETLFLLGRDVPIFTLVVSLLLLPIVVPPTVGTIAAAIVGRRTRREAAMNYALIGFVLGIGLVVAIDPTPTAHLRETLVAFGPALTFASFGAVLAVGRP